MSLVRVCLLAFLSIGFLSTNATAQDTSSASPPIGDRLVTTLETGGHRALIRSLAFAPNARAFVSAGEDKTIRVWDAQTGEIVRTIRGENTPGRDGLIDAVAISPDGALLAAGGWLQVPGQRQYYIRLYDFDTAKLVGILRGHTGRVFALAFSPDGALLLSGSEDKSAILWDVRTRQAVHILRGHGAEVRAVTFSLDGREAITGSYDATIKLWNVADGSLVQTLSGQRGMISTLAVSRREGTLAAGSKAGEIFLWQAQTGQLMKKLSTQRNAIGSVTFTSDGLTLLSTAAEGSNLGKQSVWATDSGNEVASYGGHDDIVAAAAISPDQRFAVTAGGRRNEIHVWDLATGKLAQKANGEPFVLRGAGAPVFSTASSADGNSVLWGGGSQYKTNNNRGSLDYQLRLPDRGHRLGVPGRAAAAAAASGQRARSAHQGVSLQHQAGGEFRNPDAILEIRKSGRTIGAIARDHSNGFRHLAYTIAPDGGSIISGGMHGTLRAYNLKGEEIGRYVGHEGPVWSVATSSDGAFLISGGGDQTVRIWNLKTFELLVSVLLGPEGEWVMWVPQGYYASSPAGDAMVGWQLNNGPERDPDFFAARQFKGHFYRPEIVERALFLRSAKAAIAEAKQQDPTSMGLTLDALSVRKPPRLLVVQPADNAQVSGSNAEVVVRTGDNTEPVTRLEMFVNGIQVTPTGARGFLPVASGTDLQKIVVPIGKGENRLLIRASNQVGSTESALRIFGAVAGGLDQKGTLFVIAIGVDKYPELAGFCAGKPCDLKFAGADARAFHDQLIKASKSLHDDVKSIVLSNGSAAQEKEPTYANIVDAFALLEGSKETDTVVVFLSGHGINEDVQGRKEYLFLPTDARRLPNGRFRPSSVFSWSALEEGLGKAKGRRMLFVDTCHAANSYNARIVKNAHDDNIAVFSSSDQDTVSVERGDLGHGVFTHVVLRGLGGEAARDQEVRLFGFADFVDRLVRQLTADAQQPEINTQRVKNYVIARTPSQQ